MNLKNFEVFFERFALQEYEKKSDRFEQFYSKLMIQDVFKIDMC